MTGERGTRGAHLVLVVDDDLSTSTVLEQLLQRAGLETVTAKDLAGAEAITRSRPVSLILLDVCLPDGNGLDFCERFCATSTVPVLFISANSDIATKVRGFASGGMDYIPKPLAGAEVLARVRTHLRLHAAYESLAELLEERIQRLAATQQSLMPTPSSLPGARFHACIRQALRAGGDFYDVIHSGSQTTDYIVADASGHDLGVSLWTASFKALLAEYASVLHAPHDICRMINRSLQHILPTDVYFTSIYARLNRSTNKLLLVNAGHPSALVVSPQTGRVRYLEQEGDPIGAYFDAVFGVLEIDVLPGDRLFLCSDGLLEIAGSREVGLERLIDACLACSAEPLEEAVPHIVNTLSALYTPEDDIVLLGTEI